MAELQRKGQFDKLAELQYGKLPQLEERLKAAEEGLSEAVHDQPRLMRTEVGVEEIAAVVSRATGIPVARMMQGERGKMIQMGPLLPERVLGQGRAVDLVGHASGHAR